MFDVVGHALWIGNSWEALALEGAVIVPSDLPCPRQALATPGQTRTVTSQRQHGRSLDIVPSSTEHDISLHLKNAQHYRNSAHQSHTASTTDRQPLSVLLNLLQLTAMPVS